VNDASTASLRAEALRGLRAAPKTLPPKLFYDERGAELFVRITELPEYYPTRAELEILGRRAHDIAAALGPGVALLEYGSGEGVKVRLLLDALERPAAYVPIDIAGEQLEEMAREVGAEYPHVAVAPLWADYTGPLTLPPLPEGARRVAFFPGSTIGNFHPDEARAFLRRVRRAVGPDGALVLGADLRKDPLVLHAAYNDAAGVTAEFNLNVLARLNRELGADFDLSCFRHYAYYNPVVGRVEMHLVSLCRQTATVAGEEVFLERGETIWTESSYKYGPADLEALAAGAGFHVSRAWEDERGMFVVALLE
jgi:L-histidine Nalpha-methyltransferase